MLCTKAECFYAHIVFRRLITFKKNSRDSTLLLLPILEISASLLYLSSCDAQWLLIIQSFFSWVYTSNGFWNSHRSWAANMLRSEITPLARWENCRVCLESETHKIHKTQSLSQSISTWLDLKSCASISQITADQHNLMSKWPQWSADCSLILRVTVCGQIVICGSIHINSSNLQLNHVISVIVTVTINGLVKWSYLQRMMICG